MPYLVHLLLYSNSQIQVNDPTYVLNSILSFKLCVGGCGFEMKLTHAFYSALNDFVYILLLISSGRSLFHSKFKNIWNGFPLFYLQPACYSVLCEQMWGNTQSMGGYHWISNQWITRKRILGVRTLNIFLLWKGSVLHDPRWIAMAGAG